MATYTCSNCNKKIIVKDGCTVAKCLFCGKKQIFPQVKKTKIAKSVGADKVTSLTATEVIKEKIDEVKSDISLDTSVRSLIAAGSGHSVFVNIDGTVTAIGDNSKNQCDVSDWENIVAVAAGYWHTVGLKANGTVVLAGDQNPELFEVRNWDNIIDIYSGDTYIIGLKANGTLLACGNHDIVNEVTKWTDIVSVAVKSSIVVGLKADGTVVSIGTSDTQKAKLASLSEAISVCVTLDSIIVLNCNRTIDIFDFDGVSPIDVSDWKNIIEIDAGDSFVIGLKADGTVLVKSFFDINMLDMGWVKEEDIIETPYDWSNVYTIKAGSNHAVAVTNDGFVLAVGKNDCGQCDVCDIRIFNSVRNIDAERESALKAFLTNPSLKDEKTNYLKELRNKFGPISSKVYFYFPHAFILTKDGCVKLLDFFKLTITDLEGWDNIKEISANKFIKLGLKTDGTVVSLFETLFYDNDMDDEDEDSDVNDLKTFTDYTSTWTDIIKIATASSLGLGLKSDGTVVAVGDNDWGECNVDDWNNIVDIAASDGGFSVGLKSDGTVVVTDEDYQKGVDDWRDIVKIFTHDTTIIGIKKDGSVCSTSSDFENLKGVTGFNCDENAFYGINADGMAVIINDNVKHWENIIAIADGCFLDVKLKSVPFTVGLKSNGSLIKLGDYKSNYDEFPNWEDIIAITVNYNRIIGISSDGNIKTCGFDEAQESLFSDIKLF